MKEGVTAPISSPPAPSGFHPCQHLPCCFLFISTFLLPSQVICSLTLYSVSSSDTEPALLQPPAASCSLLQPPAPSCSLLQPPAPSCSLVQPSAASCSPLQPRAAPCSPLQPPASSVCLPHHPLPFLLHPRSVERQLAF